MDSLEFFALLLFGLFAIRTWGSLCRAALELPAFGVPYRRRAAVLAIPFVCVLLIFEVLQIWAADDVRETAWVLFYTVIGAGWIALCDLGIQFLGISLRDDALERRNSAALWACAGALGGCTASFAGANVGSGPGVQVVVYSALLANGALFAVWFGIEHAVRPSLAERISVGRETATGIRLGGLLVGLGIVFGWSVAGDWKSMEKTNVDFFESAWPAFLGSALVALPLEWLLAKRPEGSEPSETWAWVIAALYVAAAAAYVAHEAGVL